MPFATINTIIRNFRTPGGITIVKHTRAAAVKGRPSLPHATLVVVEDAAHHPGAITMKKSRESVTSEGVVTGYFRQEVLTANVDPNGNDPWFLLIGGVLYEVADVQPWTHGAFWVVTGQRVKAPAQQARVFFGGATFVQQSTGAAAVLAALQSAAGRSGYTPNRSFRFDVADDGGDIVAAAWPTSIDQTEDAVAFRAVNANGDRVVVTANTVAVAGDFTVAMLPKVPGPGGRLQYEVV